MTHRVSNYVQQWRDELFENPTVDLDVLADHLPADVFAGRACRVTHGAVEDWLQRGDRNHAGALGDLLELVDDLRELTVFGDGIRIPLHLGAEYVSNAQLRSGRLPDQPVQLIDPCHGDLQGGSRFARPIGRDSRRLGRRL